jgi:hypothetical protein
MDTRTFTPLAGSERKELLHALRRNELHGHALLLDRKDTSFAGVENELPMEGDVEGARAMVAVRSVPTHF